MTKQQFQMDGYVDVATRIAEFRAKHPEGSLQPADPSQPYRVEQVGPDLFVVVVAAAYRTPDDARPGIGMAYEAYPGKTPYTRGSELQNAETSAWGRAIVAVLAGDTRAGVASADEVRNRQADRDYKPTASEVRASIARLATQCGMSVDEITADFADWTKGEHQITTEDTSVLAEYLNQLTGRSS